MLDYTGHPLVDVGIATIVAFADKDSPSELTELDFEAIADYLAQNYRQNPLRSYLTVAFMNADGFTQPAYFTKPELQELYADLVLRSFRQDVPVREEVDPFLGLPVVNVSLNVQEKLEPGRAFRQHIPLQTGVDVINFYPYGDAGLPISGLALLAIHAFPLGSAKCYGSPLLVHSTNEEIMLYFARMFLKHNQAAINLAQQADNNKLAELPRSRATLVIETLLDALRQQRRSLTKRQPFSITAYHINGGKSPSLDIYNLPSQIISYLELMLSHDYAIAWAEIVRRAWIKPKLKQGQTDPSADFEPDRNYLYEDLFRLAEDIEGRASHFIRTYFLRSPFRYARQASTDPRGRYSSQQDLSLVSWKVTAPFLRRILHMDETRIEQIRWFGDKLAEYVQGQNDKRFFRNFYLENNYGNFRTLLMKANKSHVQRGNEPILTLDTYTAIFEDGEELGKSNWWLSRDLVLIRMIEQLYAGNNWFRQNEDAFPEQTEQDEIL